MASRTETCPLCGHVVREGKHPKDSSVVGAFVQLVGHLHLYHKREIQERMKREASGGEKEEEASLRGVGS